MGDSVAPSNSWASDEASGCIQRLDEYKATIAKLFPALPRPTVDRWSIKDADALALARFLDRYPCEVVVLEVGTFIGVSTFHFASHPKVSEVISVDLNPSVAELNKRWGWGAGSLPGLRILDVAEATLARFPEQRRKVQLVAGTVKNVGQEVSANGASLVAFVDGHHSKEAVEADLRAVFEKNPHTVAVLHDCVRNPHGPGVLAGVGAFVEASQTKHRLEYRFRLFKQMDIDPRNPNLGILYPEAAVDQVERSAADLLQDPTSALFRVSYLRWQAGLQQQEAVERQRKKAERQLRRANRLESELLEARRPWWRRLLR